MHEIKINLCKLSWGASFSFLTLCKMMVELLAQNFFIHCKKLTSFIFPLPFFRERLYVLFQCFIMQMKIVFMLSIIPLHFDLCQFFCRLCNFSEYCIMQFIIIFQEKLCQNLLIDSTNCSSLNKI